MDYGFDQFDTFSFVALQGFSAPWVGTINAIAAFSGFDLLSLGQGFSVDGTAVQAAIADGNSAMVVRAMTCSLAAPNGI